MTASSPLSDDARNAPEGVTVIEHTADIGMAVSAATLTEQFARAAAGLNHALSGATPTSPGDAQRVVEADAPDVELLLVAWLRELLWLAETEGRCCCAVRFTEMSHTKLVAQVQLAECPEMIREIKGITYHGLYARQTAEGWEARVIFDV